ncbi:ComEC/Rec2 family competence protein [Mucilaginibacter lacusdianchii]|uniref:ComEC/Rec2 family competence protein n=1 Tax=Mucilaginibacter lacusdianchii TaxID=2684211 RepID=UPI00131AAABB|nr:ComEC/Rec2 family competence protein [Mucilaginibacter sp. JXJ CY 39]
MFTIRKSEVPFIILLLPFLVGIGLGLRFNYPNYVSYAYWAFGVSGSLFLLFNLLYKQWQVHRYTWLGGISLHFTLICAGWFCVLLRSELNSPHHFSRQKADHLLVKVIDEPKRSAQFFRMVCVVESVASHKELRQANGKLLLTIVADSDSHPASFGDQLLIPANYKSVDAPFNPAEFNYKQYLAHQNIYHQAFITRRQFVKTATDQGNPLIAYALKMRQSMVAAFKQHIHDPNAAAVASTLILGYKADLSPDVTQAYSTTGTIHVLSVSGAHVAVIFWFISLLLRPLRRYKYGKGLNIVLSVLLIWAYALLTGFSPAVCRAAVMISMLIISKSIYRQVHSLNVLAVSAFALLLYNPLLVTDVGFQLSYLAVFGLIVLQPIIAKQFNFPNKWMQKAWYLCSASLAAQLITFPLSAYYFHQFPIYFLISNLFIIIPSEVVMGLGMLFLVFAKLPIIGAVVAIILEYSILFMNKGLMNIERFPMASVGKIWLTPTEHVLLYLILAALISFLLAFKVWKLNIALFGLLVLCVSVSFKTYNRSVTSCAIFLNLKKHTGIILSKGNEALVITDLKPTDKTYKYSIQPCLDSLQLVKKISTINLRQNFRTPYVRKQYNLVQFQGKTILILDKHLDDVKLANPLCVNYILITGSPKINMPFINKHYKFDTLILDANNSKQRLAVLLKQGKANPQKIYSLTRNKALSIVSN